MTIFTDWTSFRVSKLKKRLHRLVWVYTCQNATLLEITWRGSFVLYIVVVILKFMTRTNKLVWDQSHCVVYLSKSLYSMLSTGSTQEGRKSSQHDWKIVDWDTKHQHKQTNQVFASYLQQVNWYLLQFNWYLLQFNWYLLQFNWYLLQFT